MNDVRYAIRTLVRQPGFTIVAVVILALGIGVNLSVFGIIDAVFLRTPPLLREPDRLARIALSFEEGYGSMRYPDYAYIRDHNRSFDGLIAYEAFGSPLMLRAAEQEEQIDGTFVSGNFFQVLGLQPALGRFFRPDEDAQGTVQQVAVISHALWERRFNRDPQAIGAPISLNGQPYTVIGVTPAEYRGAALEDSPVDVVVPMWTRLSLLSRPVEDFVLTPGHSHRFLTVLGRLRPAVTAEQAEAEMAVISNQLQAAWERDEPERIAVLADFALNPNTRQRIGEITRILAAVAGIVLLIACANLANLQLARATVRYRELGVRVALGASRPRIVRQLLTESVILAGAGTVLGLLATLWTTELITKLLPIVGTVQVEPDWRLLAVASAIAFVTGVAFGLVPALRASRADIMSSVKSGGRAAIEGRSRLRGALAVTQVALSCLLLVGAALFVRTLQRVHGVELGYDRDRALVLSLDLRAYGFNETSGTRFYEQLVERIGALPAVRSAALGSIAPLGGARRQSGTDIEGVPRPAPDELEQIDNDIVAPNYFRTLGIPLVRGRDFTERDVVAAPEVAIVNETMARRYWPGSDALGKRIRLGDEGPWKEIVGVARDVRHVSVSEEPIPFIYLPLGQRYSSRMQVFVRAAGDPADLAGPVREQVREVGPQVALSPLRTLSEIHSRSIQSFTTNAALISVLGALALVLAAVGLYGVLAFLVAQRTKEIGVRMALGARQSDVLWHITRQGMTLTAIGLVLGTAAAWFLTRAVTAQLFGVTPRDPVAFAIAIVVLATCALLASVVPARRAASVAPAEALRAE